MRASGDLGHSDDTAPADTAPADTAPADTGAPAEPDEPASPEKPASSEEPAVADEPATAREPDSPDEPDHVEGVASVQAADDPVDHSAGSEQPVPAAAHGAHRAAVDDEPPPEIRQPEPARIRRPEPVAHVRASTPPVRSARPQPAGAVTRAPAPPVLAPPPLAPPLRPSVTAGDVAALLLISLGAFVAPIVAPVLGLLLLWRSRGWQRPDKGAVTAVVALPIVAALGVIALSWFLHVWRF